MRVSCFTPALALLFVIFSPPSLDAQTAAAIAGSGYALPVPMRVAPGQVLTLFVTGLDTVLPNGGAAQNARTIPLPTSLAGVSVIVHQSIARGFAGPIPMFSIQQFNECSTATSPGCVLTALTVQIPYELAVPNPQAVFAAPATTDIAVSENGQVSKGFVVVPVSLKAHILTNCDLLTGSNVPACDPIVTHANGTLVSTSAPAAPGETLVLYGVGLGAVSGQVATGAASPSPALPVATEIGLTQRYVASRALLPSGAENGPQTGVQFAGLTPGFVGLYQINFQVDPASSSVAPCNSDSATSSNLTVSIVSTSVVLDSAGICVNTGNSVTSTLGTQSSNAHIVQGRFIPNTVRFPPGSDLSFLAQP